MIQYPYDPVSLWSCIPIYFSTTHYTQYTHAIFQWTQSIYLER